MKELESDDPMELQAIQCDGDPEYMIDCVAEEYARMGWSSEQILQLFESPAYPFLYSMVRARGSESIRRRIEKVVGRCGVFRARTLEAPEEPELVTLAPLREGGPQQ